MLCLKLRILTITKLSNIIPSNIIPSNIWGASCFYIMLNYTKNFERQIYD